jgi:hypothetical protein
MRLKRDQPHRPHLKLVMTTLMTVLTLSHSKYLSNTWLWLSVLT